MPTFSQLITLTVFGLLTLQVSGQDAGGRQMMLGAMDSNGDGTISLEEFTAADMPMLSRVDADGDGFITEQEYLAAPGGMAGAMGRGGGAAGGQLTDEQRAQVRERMQEMARARFAAIDSDGDKRITMAEFRSIMFGNMDQNQDGILSGTELTMPARGAIGGGRRNQ